LAQSVSPRNTTPPRTSSFSAPKPTSKTSATPTPTSKATTPVPAPKAAPAPAPAPKSSVPSNLGGVTGTGKIEIPAPKVATKTVAPQAYTSDERAKQTAGSTLKSTPYESARDRYIPPDKQNAVNRFLDATAVGVVKSGVELVKGVMNTGKWAITTNTSTKIEQAKTVVKALPKVPGVIYNSVGKAVNTMTTGKAEEKGEVIGRLIGDIAISGVGKAVLKGTGVALTVAETAAKTAAQSSLKKGLQAIKSVEIKLPNSGPQVALAGVTSNIPASNPNLIAKFSTTVSGKPKTMPVPTPKVQAEIKPLVIPKPEAEIPKVQLKVAGENRTVSIPEKVDIKGGLDGAQAMLKTQSANAWGTLADGTNQGIKHFSNYWEAYPERIPSIANRLGVDPADFSNTVSGFENFTKAAQNVIGNPTQMRVVNGKSLYFVEGAENVNKGVTVIVQDGKIQSMMPTALKDFLKLK